MSPTEGFDASKLYVEMERAALSAAAGPTKAAITALLAKFKGYGPYIAETHRKVSSFRSLINPNQNV